MLCCIDFLTLENYQIGWLCLKSPYNALQTLDHWLRHVCLCIVLLAPFLKKLAPKTSLHGPLWPSSKIFWLKHCILSQNGLLQYHTCTCRFQLCVVIFAGKIFFDTIKILPLWYLHTLVAFFSRSKAWSYLCSVGSLWQCLHSPESKCVKVHSPI